ncbi:YpdA family putative bacillithiol disulfide reductase [Roseivirga sp. BDSF3-8]|uniref:YpdA family putative bacillithiol disulfide reductase n=1 Tax=Roseivirga sp. BDSF3-8 TaxID=3241598 RepID=UPI003531C000
MTDKKVYDTLIIGAGPCGLACGIEAKKAGLDYLIIDKGSITESIRRYPINMTFFSTSENIEIGDIPFTSAEMRPTRTEALRYYRRVVDHFDLNLQLFTCVEDIRNANEIFSVITNKGTFLARKVVLAIGYYDLPRLIHVPGEDLPHVSHYYDEAYQYSTSEVVVVGGANSAIETALDLYRNGARVTVVHQFGDFDDTAKYWITPDIRNRVKKGDINAHFSSKITSINEKEIEIKHLESGDTQTIPADFVFLMTGYRPDAELMERIGVTLNGEAFIPEFNQNSFETNVPGIYVAGSVVGGEETAKIFIENGKEHGKQVIAHIKEVLETKLQH